MSHNHPVGALSAARLDHIDKMFEDYVSRAVIPGAVSLLWYRGDIAHTCVVGWQDEEARIPMRRDSLFRIASMTKPITSVAALMLIEQGAMELQSRIDYWLPEFNNPRVLRNLDGPLDDVTDASRPITVLDLLTHRSGIAYDFTVSGPLSVALKERFTEFNTGMTSDEWLRRIARLPLLFQPGARWQYGMSTDVLGVLIERVSGMAFPDYLQSRIFAPLGMDDTGFYVPPNKLDRFTVAYRAQPHGVRQVFDHPQSSQWTSAESLASGGGGLVSSADDYLRFARMLLGKGKLEGVRLISPKSFALMTGNYMTAEDRATEVFGCPFFSGQRFGLGLAVTDDEEKREKTIGYGSLGSFWWGGVYGTSWLGDPVEQMIPVLMTQLQCEGLTLKLNAEYLALAYGAIDR